MNWLIGVLGELVDDMELWLPALGLLLVACGMLITSVHIFGGGR